MTNLELVEIAKKAVGCKTLYVMGAFGAPLNAKNRKRYSKNNSYNKQPDRQIKILNATDDTFAFDCVGFAPKGLLWGWNADTSKVYGGAKYKSNGVPDTNADGMIRKCYDVSTDFSVEPEIGELVWLSGHVGLYLGDWLVAESSPIWKDGVQITACNRKVAGYNRRNWTKHGKLPWVDYVKPEPEPTPEPPTPEPEPEPVEFQVGDAVRLTPDATVYNKAKRFSKWVYNRVLYIRQLKGNRAVVSIYKHIGVTGAVDTKYLVKV